MALPIDKIRHYSGVTILALLPIAALFGNAPADIALVLTVIVFLGTSENIIQILKQSRFIQLSVVFWLWILLCSALSLFPKHSFQDSLPWIRFPLYAFALSIWLSEMNTKHKNALLIFSGLGTIIEIGFMLTQFISRRVSGVLLEGEGARLSGTFDKLMAGWYVVCFGLIVSLTLLQLVRSKKISGKSTLLAIIFVLLSAFSMIISGEVVNTLAFFATIFLFFFLQKPKDLKENRHWFIGFVFASFIFLIFAWFDQGLHHRIIHAFSNRLPWQSTSDYYAPLKAGYDIALQNMEFGVGPKNLFKYCVSLREKGLMNPLEQFGVNECPWHPHNLYLQIAAETGLIGLILFCLISIYLGASAVSSYWKSHDKNNIASAIILIALFPIQTYSQAFGQSRNFYLWTVIGFALSIIRSQKIKNDNDQSKLI